MATRMAIDELALKLDDTVFALIETVAVDEGSLAKGRDSRRNGGRPAQLSILARVSLMDHGAGQSAPASTHARMMRPNSACDPGAGERIPRASRYSFNSRSKSPQGITFDLLGKRPVIPDSTAHPTSAQVLGQLGPRAVQPGLHSSDRPAEGLGDLFVG